MRILSMAASLAVLCLACTSEPAPTDIVGPPAALVIVSGNNQVGTVGVELSESLVAQLKDAQGRGISGRSVTFVVTSGGGSLFTAAALATDGSGRAATRWTLGKNADAAQSVQARLVDAETGRDFTADFTATALADAAAKIAKIAGDEQSGFAAVVLKNALVVQVTDRYDNPVGGVTIAWSAHGGGALLPAIGTTGPGGFAETVWTLGPLEGVDQLVTASLTGIGSVTFHATFLQPPTFDPHWESVAPLPFAVRSAATATDGARIYVFAGYGAEGRSSHTQIYDPATNSWSLGADVPIAVDVALAGVTSSGIHLFGGFEEGVGRSRAHYVYRPETDSWIQGPNLLTGVNAASGRVIDDNMYVVGGVTTELSVRLRDVQVYRTASDSWTRANPVPTAHLNSVAAVVDGRLHVMGGNLEGLVTSNQHRVFDPATNAWMVAPSLPASRETAGAGTTFGRLCVFGGRFSTPGGVGAPFGDTWCLAPSTNRWETMPSMPIPRAEAASVSLDGWIYAIGGHDNSLEPVAMVERFTGVGLLLSEAIDGDRDMWAVHDAGPTPGVIVADPSGPPPAP